MDQFAAMRCFCRVVERGSFAAAARDLDCSRSVVTKHVQDLENWVQARLLIRNTRSLHLTDEGQKFFAYCCRILEDTNSTMDDLRGLSSAPRGRIVISMPVSLGLSVLGAHLHDFQLLHENLELEVRLDDRVVNLFEEGVDLALRGRAQLEDSNLVAVPLMDMPRVVAATPGFWSKHGHPVHPRELENLPCLAYLLGSDAFAWNFTDASGARHSVEVKGPFMANNSLLLIDAMKRGVGAGLVPEVMIRGEISRGELVVALEDFRVESRKLYAVLPGREHMPARVRALLDFLKEKLSHQLATC